MQPAIYLRVSEACCASDRKSHTLLFLWPQSLFHRRFYFSRCPGRTLSLTYFLIIRGGHASAGCAHVSECVLSVSMCASVRLHVSEERAVWTCMQSHHVKPCGDTCHSGGGALGNGNLHFLIDVSARACRAVCGNRRDVVCGCHYLWGDVVGGFILCFSAGARGRSLIYTMPCRWPA